MNGPVVRVLIVDDDKDNLKTLAVLLELAGYESHTASDGLRGIESTQRYRPHCAVLDIDLPGLDGFDIARRVRREPWGREMVLIAMSGWSGAEDRTAAMAAGFDHFLPKPARFEALLELLPPARSAAA